MLGPETNSVFIIIGSLVGSYFGQILKPEFRKKVMNCFTCITLGIGVVMTAKVNALPVVVISLLAGLLIGEGLSLEPRVMDLAIRASGLLRRKGATTEGVQDKSFRDQFAVVTVLFCFSGLGILGSMHEGMTGDPSLLFIKALLDLSTAMIFAASIGAVTGILSLPQFLIQAAILLAAEAIVPLTTPAMLQDFTACGGIIMLGTGLRQCGLLEVPILSMLPALLLVLPASALWQHFFA